MAFTDVADLRAMTADGLLAELEESQRALFNVRFQAATRQLVDVTQIRGARRRIARVKTLLREREILVEYGALLEADGSAGIAGRAAPAAAVAEAELAEGDDAATSDDNTTDDSTGEDATAEDGDNDGERE
ncbi:MAG: 50S ribosomal protein L29 [Chloroflexi bacterium]|nr:50S ribosomal protein L29 [Chloroflexota bacterium]